MVTPTSRTHVRGRSSRLGAAQRVVLTAVLALALGAVTLRIYVANQVSIEIPSMNAKGEVQLIAGEELPVVILIDPPRRTEGATVTLDGQSVAHPAGDEEGQLVWTGRELAPGLHSLTITVPRPTWFAASLTVPVVVEAP